MGRVGRLGRLRVGFLAGHLHSTDEVRHVAELADGLAGDGHQVVVYTRSVARTTIPWIDHRFDIRPVADGRHDPLDVLCFCHAMDWFLVGTFTNVRRSVYYAIEPEDTDGMIGVHDAPHAAVDLQIASSPAVASALEARTGRRPEIVLPGLDLELFAPGDDGRRARVLTPRHGDGPDAHHDLLHARAALARAGVTAFDQRRLGRTVASLAVELSHCSLFVTGRRVDGSGRATLEALASGVPVVSTDTGAVPDLAAVAEVVPIDDVQALADAICASRCAGPLAERLALGRELVEQRHDARRQRAHFVEVLEGVLAGWSAPPPPRPAPPPEPELSVVVLAWNNLELTQAFVETVRRNTDVPYELVVVDNGSSWPAPEYACAAADTSVLHERNLGFSMGMNAGLAVARGRWVAFCNNDTRLPPGWASTLLSTACDNPRAGIVVPAVTESQNPINRRGTPGDAVIELSPFDRVPSAVVYLMPAQFVRDVGGWGEEYAIASGEDLDLVFKVWVNDRSVVYDQRVLVDHVGKASAVKLGNWEQRWEWNRRMFLRKWQDPALDVPRLVDVDDERFAANLADARRATTRMEGFYRRTSAVAPRSIRRRIRDRVRPIWRRVRTVLPERLRERWRPSYDKRRSSTRSAAPPPAPLHHHEPLLVQDEHGVTSVLDAGVIRPFLDSRTEDALRQKSMSLVVVTSAELANLPVGEPFMLEPSRAWSVRFRSGSGPSQRLRR